MKIKWYGHSCFQITTNENVRILTDPCDPETGYKLHDIDADIVTISHMHHDHNYLAAVNGTPIIIDTATTFTGNGIKIVGILSYHDEDKGNLRGKNTIFNIFADGLKLTHVGDLGTFDSALVESIGSTDVLFVPIGGVYTIAAEQALELARCLHTKIIIPMHYKTPQLAFELDDLSTFVSLAKGLTLHKLNTSEAVLEKEFLSADRALLFRVD